MVLLQRKKILFQESREGSGFSRGGNFFQGVQMLISIETHITCDFPGGGVRTPIFPLDPHMAMLGVIDICAYAMSTN